MLRSIAIAVTVAVASSAAAATPVLRVNGHELSQRDLELSEKGVTMLAQGKPMDDATMRRDALDQLITRVLLVDAAKAAGLKVDEAAVKQAVATQEARAGGQEAFEASLKQVGMSREELEQMDRDRDLISRYAREVVAPKITVDAEAARKYYDTHPDEFKHPEQLKLSMIFVPAAGDAPAAEIEAARKKVEAAAARVRSGEDFATVAREVSQDRSAEKGGEVGWVHRGMLLPKLENAVWGAEAGSLSPVVQTEKGFHLLRVDAKRGEGLLPWDEVKDTLPQYLTGKALQEEMAQIVKRERAKATIEGLTPEIQKDLAGGGSS